MPPPRAAPVKAEATVVYISPLESETLFLRQVLVRNRTVVKWFPTCKEALAFIRRHHVGVVVSETETGDGCWKDLLDSLSRFTPQPNLIVCSRFADERLWAEVLNLGGYDVILTPFEADEVLRVTSLALLDWKQNKCKTLTRRKVAKEAASLRPTAEKQIAAAVGD